MGTAGALKQLENKIKSDFLALSGDVMVNFDIKRFLDWHQNKKGKIASIFVHPNDHPFDSNLVELDNDNRLIALWERPYSPKKFYSNLSISSVYLFTPRIFKYIKSDLARFDIERNLIPVVLKLCPIKEKIEEYIKGLEGG